MGPSTDDVIRAMDADLAKRAEAIADMTHEKHQTQEAKDAVQV